MTGLIFYVMSDFLFQIENRGPDIDADRIIPFHSERTSFRNFSKKVPENFFTIQYRGLQDYTIFIVREQFRGENSVS